MSKILIAITIIVVLANSGKVNWDNLDKDGNPTVEKSEKPAKGCFLGSLGSLGQENNSSKTFNCKK